MLQEAAHQGDGFSLIPVRTAADLSATIDLFKAYASALDIELSYQDFEAELAAMPGKYAPPAGELLLARDAHGQPVGCVALRPLPEQGCCEMKRLYVSPGGRGLGLGRELVDAVIEVAQHIGYREMRLDTLPTMASALGLYRSTGFVATPPYYDTPIADTVFLARQL